MARFGARMSPVVTTELFRLNPPIATLPPGVTGLTGPAARSPQLSKPRVARGEESWHASAAMSSDLPDLPIPLATGGTLIIPSGLLSVKAVRSSGPGGQNVNKVSTKVELRFDLASDTTLSAPARARLLALCKSRMDADGQIIITSEATRNRLQNLTDAREKLAALIARALTPPKPRHKTRPTLGSKIRRVEDKRQTSEKKKTRGRPASDD